MLSRSILALVFISIALALPARADEMPATEFSNPEVVVGKAPESFERKSWIEPFAEGGYSYNQTAYSSLYSVFGGTWDLGIGAMFYRTLSLEVFHQFFLGATGDFGILGGGFYSGDTNGARAEIQILPFRRHDLKLGVQASLINVSGIRAVMMLPYAVDQVNTWGFGPTFAYLFRFDNKLGLQLRMAYLMTAPKADLPRLSNFDIGLAAEFRPFN